MTLKQGEPPASAGGCKAAEQSDVPNPLERALFLCGILCALLRRHPQGRVLFIARQAEQHTWVVICRRRDWPRAIWQLARWAFDRSLPLRPRHALGLAVRLTVQLFSARHSHD